MWALLVVVAAPDFDDSLRLGERGELMDVQTLLAQPPIKRFNEGILHGFPGSNEVELDATVIGPILQRPWIGILCHDQR